MPDEVKNIDICLVITTWPNHPKRWEYFSMCIPRILGMVRASRHTKNICCISETQKDPEHKWFGEELSLFCTKYQIPLAWRNGNPGLGKMMNDATAIGIATARYSMIIQDDWYLNSEIDLSDGIDFMDENKNVDTLRYSWPVGMTSSNGEFNGFRTLAHDGPWPYGDDPHIRRDTFVERFGKYSEYERHGASEGAMVFRFKARKAFVCITDKCYFGHCGHVPAVIKDEREQNKNRSCY